MDKHCLYNLIQFASHGECAGMFVDNLRKYAHVTKQLMYFKGFKKAYPRIPFRQIASNYVNI